VVVERNMVDLRERNAVCDNRLGIGHDVGRIQEMIVGTSELTNAIRALRRRGSNSTTKVGIIVR
jgi:hypothetical protein